MMLIPLTTRIMMRMGMMTTTTTTTAAVTKQQQLLQLLLQQRCCYHHHGHQQYRVPPLQPQQQQQQHHHQYNYSSSSSGNSNDSNNKAKKVSSTLYYLAAVGVLVAGGSYAAVPLYRIFCQSYSYGGTVGTHDATKDLSKMKRIKEKEITIRFNADKSSNLMWNFRPEQTEIVVTPGETALAFYRAENRTPLPIDGVSTYNVIPFEAGQYFNKIQCFCFEEQRLNPGETVELPVFFYIDPEFVEDPSMESVDLIILSYTFFESKDMPAGGWGLMNFGGGGGGGGGHGGSSNKKSQSQIEPATATL